MPVRALVLAAALCAEGQPYARSDAILWADVGAMSADVVDHLLRGEQLPIGGFLLLPASVAAMVFDLGPIPMILLGAVKLAAHVVPHWIPGFSRELPDV